MSVKAIGWALECKVGPGAKLVLVTLGNFADSEGYCYPSQKTLARLTSQTERTVRTHLAALESAGLITRPANQRRADGGLFGTDTYRLQLAPSDGDTTPSPPLPARAEDISAGDGRKISTPRAESSAGPIENRQLEPSVTNNQTGAREAAPRRHSVDDERPPRDRSAGRTKHAGTDGSAEAFEAFKRAYPSRGDASNPWKPARQKFDRAVWRGTDPQAIIDGALGYAKAMQKSGKAGTEFVAMATTFLNQERWPDHQEAGKTARERASTIDVYGEPAIAVTSDCPPEAAERWRRFMIAIWTAEPAKARSWLPGVSFDGTRPLVRNNFVRQYIDGWLGREIEEAGFERIEVADPSFARSVGTALAAGQSTGSDDHIARKIGCGSFLADPA